MSEVSVGAYARRQRSRRWILGAFGAALALGAVAISLLLNPFSGMTKYNIAGSCVSCGYEGIVQVANPNSGPYRCPKCGQTACRELWQCSACAKRFTLAQQQGIIRCPGCGSDAVGAANLSESKPTSR